MLKNEAPEKVYLQWQDDYVLGADDGEITWCRDKINDNDVVYVLEEARQRETDRQRLLGMAKGNRDSAEFWHGAADKLVDLWDQRNRWSAAWKAAAKKWRAKAKDEHVTRQTWEDICKMKHGLLEEVEAERDELQQKVEMFATLADEAGRGGELRADWVLRERDELQRQLKAVTDCIVHYAPSDFPILKYDSAADALNALLEKKHADTTV